MLNIRLLSLDVKFLDLVQAYHRIIEEIYIFAYRHYSSVVRLNRARSRVSEGSECSRGCCQLRKLLLYRRFCECSPHVPSKKLFWTSRRAIEQGGEALLLRQHRLNGCVAWSMISMSSSGGTYPNPQSNVSGRSPIERPPHPSCYGWSPIYILP